LEANADVGEEACGTFFELVVNEGVLGRYVTLSIGIATYQFPGTGTANTLLETSDQALYMAKERGRNRIELSAMYVFSEHFFDH
jgi:GGDEF domain-containing protein